MKLSKAQNCLLEGWFFNAVGAFNMYCEPAAVLGTPWQDWDFRTNLSLCRVAAESLFLKGRHAMRQNAFVVGTVALEPSSSITTWIFLTSESFCTELPSLPLQNDDNNRYSEAHVKINR